MARRDGYRWFRSRWQPSAAERRVLDELALGRTNAEIAVRFGLSPETVKSHIARLLAQSSCSDREALARWWLAHRRRVDARAPLHVALERTVGVVLPVAALVLVAALLSYGVLRSRDVVTPPQRAPLMSGTSATPQADATNLSGLLPSQPQLPFEHAELMRDSDPALGDVPGERFIGRLVIELSWGNQIVSVNRQDWYPLRPVALSILAVLDRTESVPSTPRAWPTTPLYLIPAPGDTFRGRLVADVWEHTVRVAVTVASGTEEDLLLSLRWFLREGTTHL